MLFNIDTLKMDELQYMAGFLKYNNFCGSNLSKKDIIAILMFYKGRVGGMISTDGIETAFDEEDFVIYKESADEETIIKNIINTDMAVFKYNGVYITAIPINIIISNDMAVDNEVAGEEAGTGITVLK